MTPGMLAEIEDYWTSRSDGYSMSVMETIEDGRYRHWLNIIEGHIGTDSKLDVLDVGCGPGFFPIILGREGHRVTAVDYTQAMLDEASENCARYGVDAVFERMDAQNLAFEDESFDLVISRNLVWNLEDPERAYSEWMRVLRPGGRLMVFDGNHYLHLYDECYREAGAGEDERHQHKHLEGVDVNVMRDIAMDLPLSRERRPQWDVDLLIENGVQRLVLETDGRDSYRIEKDGKTLYLPFSFFICATK